MKGVPHEFRPSEPIGLPDAPKAQNGGPEGAPSLPKAPPELTDRGVGDKDEGPSAADVRAFLGQSSPRTGEAGMPQRALEMKDLGAIQDAPGLDAPAKQQILDHANDIKSNLSDLGKALLNRDPQAMRDQAGKVASRISDSIQSLTSRIGEFLKTDLPAATKTALGTLQQKAGELQKKVSEFATKLKGMSPKDIPGAISKLRTDLSNGLWEAVFGKNPNSSYELMQREGW